MAPTAIGALIAHEREKIHGWSLVELSDRCGQIPQTIHAIERGASKRPRLETVLPISDALGIPRKTILDALSQSLAERAKAFPAAAPAS